MVSGGNSSQLMFFMKERFFGKKDVFISFSMFFVVIQFGLGAEETACSDFAILLNYDDPNGIRITLLRNHSNFVALTER